MCLGRIEIERKRLYRDRIVVLSGVWRFVFCAKRSQETRKVPDLPQYVHPFPASEHVSLLLVPELRNFDSIIQPPVFPIALNLSNLMRISSDASTIPNRELSPTYQEINSLIQGFVSTSRQSCPVRKIIDLSLYMAAHPWYGSDSLRDQTEPSTSHRSDPPFLRYVRFRG